MHNTSAPWQERFGLTTCAASDLEQTIPPEAPGVAVIYARAAEKETIFLVIESRAKDLRGQCARRLKTAKLPPVGALVISFQAEALPYPTPEAVHAACRRQVVLAGALRRELRPSMRCSSVPRQSGRAVSRGVFRRSEGADDAG